MKKPIKKGSQNNMPQLHPAAESIVSALVGDGWQVISFHQEEAQED